MGVEMHLWRVVPETVSQMQGKGVAVLLDDPHWEIEERPWLLLDEFILAFLSYENPPHATLYKSVMGGTMFEDSHPRDEWPRYLTPQEVQELARELAAIPEAVLRARQASNLHIFGGALILPISTDEEAYAYLRARFDEVKSHYQEAARNQEAMLLLMY